MPIFSDIDKNDDDAIIEKFEPYLIDELEEKWGDLNESIGITGCEKQCYRPATKTIGWIGTGFNLYQLTLMGTEDGRNQGGALIDPYTKEQYLHFVPRKDVAAFYGSRFVRGYFSGDIGSLPLYSFSLDSLLINISYKTNHLKASNQSRIFFLHLTETSNNFISCSIILSLHVQQARAFMASK